jgi:serine/threonine protein kinase
MIMRELMSLSECHYVALKMFVRAEALGNDVDRELDVFRRISKITKQQPGHASVRTLLDSFELDGPNGRHRCLVHKPLWESVRNIKNSNEVVRLPTPVVALILKNVFEALELLHNECHVVHTDIKEANILLEADSSVLQNFEKQELKDPSPRKEVDGHPIYVSRELGMPKEFGTPALCDFGTAIPLDDGREHREDIQHDVYRAPEIILDIPWSYSVDIWNVGCMVSAQA